MGHPHNRAERRFHRNRVIANRVKEYHVTWSYEDHDDDVPGRCAKKSPFDCGNPRCYLCHSDKFDRREKYIRRHAWKKEVRDD